MALAMRYRERNKRTRMNERGMSLIEILIALTILALAVLGLMPLFVGAVKTVASSSQLTNANTLVREKLEELDGYPRDDPRLAVPAGKDAAVPTGKTISGATVGPCDTPPGGVNTYCDNDLPRWYNPSTGATCTPPGIPPDSCTDTTSPGAGWYDYPYVRTYTVEQLAPLPVPTPPGAPDDAWMNTRVVAPSPYAVKRVTVTVYPTRGPFPGLRQTTQSLYLRTPNG
jgi:prepilin-type N-terminal cleavage/methylation domain-containing protein